VAVWDLPTRVFHWLLALLVVANFFSAEDEGALLALHTYCGYLVGLLLIFRVVWGVIGNQHARFPDFLRPWPETRDYLRQLLRLSPPRYVGHNPVGGWMIIVMLVTLGVAVVSGMATAAGDGVEIPLLPGLPEWLHEASEEIHETAAHVMMVLAGVHVVGVSVDWLLTGENIIKSMITGRKTSEQPAMPAPPIGAGRGLVLAALVLIAAGWMIDQTRFDNVEAEHEQYGERHDEGEGRGYDGRHEDDEDDRHEEHDDDD
jgi:cytochrome b